MKHVDDIREFGLHVTEPSQGWVRWEPHAGYPIPTVDPNDPVVKMLELMASQVEEGRR